MELSENLLTDENVERLLAMTSDEIRVEIRENAIKASNCSDREVLMLFFYDELMRVSCEILMKRSGLLVVG